MVEQSGECLLIILFKFKKLIQKLFLFFFVLEPQGCVLEDIQDDIFWLLLQEDVTDTEKSC